MTPKLNHRTDPRQNSETMGTPKVVTYTRGGYTTKRWMYPVLDEQGNVLRWVPGPQVVWR